MFLCVCVWECVCECVWEREGWHHHQACDLSEEPTPIPGLWALLPGSSALLCAAFIIYNQLVFILYLLTVYSVCPAARGQSDFGEYGLFFFLFLFCLFFVLTFCLRDAKSCMCVRWCEVLLQSLTWCDLMQREKLGYDYCFCFLILCCDVSHKASG